MSALAVCSPFYERFLQHVHVEREPMAFPLRNHWRELVREGESLVLVRCTPSMDWV